jgi:hypothetical protein
MTQVTELARGHITRAHEIAVVFQEQQHDVPAMVLIEWPDQPTITTPHQLPATIAKCMHLLAHTTIELARIRRDRKL